MKTKLELAKEAVERLFSDTSVSAERTKDMLEELREDIDMKLHCLEVDAANRRASEARAELANRRNRR
jgi:hypothetical protein